MSARLSTVLPRACSGDMYAAVPRIIPVCVIAGDVIVVTSDPTRLVAAGSIAFARPKSRTLTVPSGLHLDVRGLQIAMNDPLLVRGFERLGDLLGDWQRLVERNRAARNALRQILALDEFHDERRDVGGLLETVDRRDVRMVEGREHFGFALKAREAIRIAGDRRGQHFDRHRPLQIAVGRAIDLAHAAGADGGDDLIGTEARAGDQGQGWRDYMVTPALGVGNWKLGIGVS